MNRGTLRRIALAAAAGVVLTAVACTPPDQRTGSIDPDEVVTLSAEVAARLDSGNAAWRADDWTEAVRHYRAVTIAEPEVAAGWFGLFMAHRALGDVESAEAALERARELAPGASLLRVEPADTLR